MTVHLCQAPTITFRRVRECPACRLRTRFVAEDHAWWGTDWTCCNCGAEFTIDAGRRRQTPKKREARLRAKSAWQMAPPRRDAEAALLEYLYGDELP